MRLRSALPALAALALALLSAAASAQESHAPAAPATAPSVQGQPAQPDSSSRVGAEHAPAVQGGLQQSLGGEHGAEGAGHGAPASEENVDIIMPHITDSRHMEIPWFNAHLAKEIPTWPSGWGRLHVGGLDLTPTKHVWMLLLAATLTALVLIFTARAHARHHHEVGRPKGFASGLEAVVLYVRNDVVMSNVGHGGEGYAPLLLTFFFFILFANMLGLIPFGSTATGNISVTATLAVIAFITIEVAGMRALGKEYIGTIVYWPHDMPNGPMKVFLALILTPVELLGKFTKPFALAIRLFANMTAGHVIVLAFIGIIFTFGSFFVAIGPLLGALAIMALEVLVALLQAYIFTLLVSVFIGQIRTAHH
jgi:F-type H+-transporting ATPase subunit a